MSKSHSYLKSTSGFKRNIERVREDFELQYNDKHQVEKVKVGETDLVKEVNSHVNEVGLLNAFRMAVARGEDPYVKFGKYEAGIPVSVDPNATLDDLNEAIQAQTQKYEELANALGVSVAQLQAAAQTPGGLEALVSASTKSTETTEVKEGE